MRHKTIYLRPADAKRQRQAERKANGVTLLLCTLAACLAIAGPCLILFGASPSPMHPLAKLALIVAGIASILIAATIPAYLPPTTQRD